MTTSLWSRRHHLMQHDPIAFLNRRSLFPGDRQTDFLLRQKVALAKGLYSKDLRGHFGCVNGIEFSHGTGKFVASGGDDRRILLWNMEKAISDIGEPVCMKGNHNSNIFCLAFDINNRQIFSGGNDEQVIVHDIETGETKDVFMHEDAVYGLSADPTSEFVFASACDDGRVLIYDIRESTADPFVLANYTSSMHAVMYNPVEPRLLATANAKEGVALWDVRCPRTCLLRYGGSMVQQSCMSVRINQKGDQILALRRRLPPVLYKIDSHIPVCEFDHSGYYNSCTMKSCCFAGDKDQYVLSGSDEFNLYMWAIPEDLSERLYINSAHLVLKGHRSIVNQVRFNAANHMIISSGVEKVIKVWSPYYMKGAVIPPMLASLSERPVYTHEEYINLVLRSGHVMSHDYTQESTEEDPRMIAFFDSLVQRELEGWSSDDDLSSNEEEIYNSIMSLSHIDSDTDEQSEHARSGNNSDDSDMTMSLQSPFTIAFASVMASQTADGSDRFPRLLGPEERPARQSETSQDNQSEQNSSVLDSQQLRGSRRAISDLVAKKRREMRAAAETIRAKKRRVVATFSSSDSSDEDNRTKPKKETEHTTNIVGHPENVKNAERQRKLLRLKHLKNLRTRIENSDTEGSDPEVKSDSKHDKKVVPSSSETSRKSQKEETEVPSTSGTYKSKLSSESNGASYTFKRRHSPDLGPFLHEIPTTSTCTSNSSHSHENVVIQSSSGICDRKDVKREEIKCGKGNDGDNTAGICSSSFEKVCGSNQHQSNSNSHEKPCGSKDHQSNLNSPEDNTEDPQPTWTEFKRFKHKMERAHRHYRKHRHSDRNQSDDD